MTRDEAQVPSRVFWGTNGAGQHYQLPVKRIRKNEGTETQGDARLQEDLVCPPLVAWALLVRPAE